MAAATTCHVSCSSAFSDNYGESSINDHSYCEILKTEIQVLHNELKSLTEIINILNTELKRHVQLKIPQRTRSQLLV